MPKGLGIKGSDHQRQKMRMTKLCFSSRPSA